jgi:neutral/alkaline ceramidase-like enzyme
MSKRAIAITWIIAFGLVRADVVEQGPKDAAPSGLLAAVARADITPPVGIAQMNWGSQTHVEATGIDPMGMKATALVLSDGKTRFAMVEIDCLALRGLEPAIEKAARKTDIPAAHIRLAASHTHAGPMVSAAKGPPGLDLDPYRQMADRHREQTIDKIVGIIVEANSQLQPAHLYGARGTGTININRRVRANGEDPPAVGRNPDGFVDRDLIVFRIDDRQGRPVAVLANFQCHGTVLAYENKQISPDWMGMTRKVVEQALPGALCLYFQGAAGNQGPVEGFTGDLAVAHRLGTILGHQVAALAHGVETVQREPVFEGFVESTAYQARQHWRVKGPRDATLRFGSALVEVPRRQHTKAEVSAMEKRLQRATEQLQSARGRQDEWSQYQAGARVRRFSDLLDQWKLPVSSEPLHIEIQALRIGDQSIVAMPGEPFAEIGVAVKKASPFPNTMFCGYSDGAGGDYVPTADEYRHGGYEVERSPYGPGTDRLVTSAAIELLRTLQ